MLSQTPAMQIDKEIRFAVVMYGGVSLAIYINGVAQELFQLARATATDPAAPERPLHDSLVGTAPTYRWLAQLLSMDPSAREALDLQVKKDPLALEEALTPDRSIYVKFVIDSISGTSAGGINGVFLGKALARNEDIDQLRRMWVEEGDILKLINDNKSISDLGDFPKPDKPTALLNGQRMYRRLVEALDNMDPKPLQEKPVASGYVNDLDVFVTATDVNGLPVFLKLSDGVVTERRYRNVFHFRHRQDGPKVEEDDFGNDKNPLLAFAARCTSSFPVAFEPMRLETIGEVLATVEGRRHQKTLGSDENFGKDLFPLYRPTADIPSGQDWYSFWKRPFCDGGYLDNKPFSYAIDMLTRRVPRCPGERKLIYIEPDPEHAKSERQPGTPPNALANAVLAKTLSAYETIREDLERVLERNTLVERVERLLSGSDEDVRAWKSKNLFEDEKEFLNGDMYSLIDRYGPAYGGYHRLKIGDLTDEIGDWLGAGLDFAPQSGHVLGLRLLVRAWREPRYSPRRSGGQSDTENTFLYDFDLLYRIRRLRFVLRRLDSLKALKAKPETACATVEAALKKAGILDRPKEPWSLKDVLWVLDELRNELCIPLASLVKARSAMRTPAAKHPLAAAIGSARVSPDILATVLRGRTFQERFDAAKEVLKLPEMQAGMTAIAQAIKVYVESCRKAAKKSCDDAFDSLLRNSSAWPRSVVELTKSYYDNYQGYDFVSFPIVYATHVGEEIATTEVIRISPEDAKSLVDASRGDPRQKLAGTALMHFGAFFEQSWRKNDMLWGRLDGAERLITSLLPQSCPNLTSVLVRDAQRRILEEHYRPISDQAVLGFASKIVGSFPEPTSDTRRMLTYVLKAAASDKPELDKETREKLAVAVKESRVNAALVEEALRHGLDADNLLRFFGSPDGYEVGRELTASTTAQALSRATTVFGKVLDGIGDEYKSNPAKRLGAWLSRLGRAFWGLVEVATPRSLTQVLGRHAIHIAYLLEGFIILGGLALGHADATKLGWGLLLLTVALNFVAWIIHDWLTGRETAVFTVKVLAGLVVTGLALFGAYRVMTDYPAVREFLCSTAGLDCRPK